MKTVGKHNNITKYINFTTFSYHNKQKDKIVNIYFFLHLTYFNRVKRNHHLHKVKRKGEIRRQPQNPPKRTSMDQKKVYNRNPQILINLLTNRLQTDHPVLMNQVILYIAKLGLFVTVLYKVNHVGIHVSNNVFMSPYNNFLND